MITIKNKKDIRFIKKLIRDYKFDKGKIEYLNKITGSPLNLENYDYVTAYILDNYPIRTGQPQPSILDIGCFVGLFVDFLKKLGYSNVFGIDNSEAFVKAAKKIGINIKLGDARNLSNFFNERSFDFVSCIQMIHNDYNKPLPEVNKFILDLFQEVKKVLKKKGIFFCNAYIPLPLKDINLIGFENMYSSFSDKTKNYIFKNTI